MKKVHVLLVDDNPDLLRTLTPLLETHDYIVEIAHNGEEALTKAGDKPDLVLLDIMLPDMSGYEVCRRMREEKLTSHIPIIMLTAKEDPKEKVEGFYMGADDYVTKPFELEELLARMEAVLRRTKNMDQLRKDKASAIAEVKRIIKDDLIVPHFQPVFKLNPRELIGFEVLSRPPVKGYFVNSDILFDAAFHVGMLFELEKASHRKALVTLGKLAKGRTIFFNISPYILQDDKFREFVEFYKKYTKPGNIGLELTERTAIKNFAAFIVKLKDLKKEGFGILIDDVGSGYASLSTVVDIKPDFLKIDRHLIHGVKTNSLKAHLIKAIVAFAKQSNILTIAEGVEEQVDLDAVMELGVDAAQGFLLGRPNADIKTFL
ncbi:MAG: EAL domain-containing protein [Candidatus Omnitrophota bacterium]